MNKVYLFMGVMECESSTALFAFHNKEDAEALLKKCNDYGTLTTSFTFQEENESDEAYAARNKVFDAEFDAFHNNHPLGPIGVYDYYFIKEMEVK